MPLGVEAEATQVYEEARSALATVIANVMGIIRQILAWALTFAKSVFDFSANHPEAFILLVGNALIWLT
ncbi:hypothetical protein KEJ27_09815 [Candidatus Bathyarchaeota archaeon]|nr:hypothetical protein [Candidatus Bathyarchaeota archaeon]